MQDYAEHSNVMLFCNWILVDGIQHQPGIVLFSTRYRFADTQADEQDEPIYIPSYIFLVICNGDQSQRIHVGLYSRVNTGLVCLNT